MSDDDTLSQDDAMLMALADDELDADTARALRARMAADPALAARHALYVDSRRAMRAAWPEEPLPERLLASLADPGTRGGQDADHGPGSGRAAVIRLAPRQRLVAAGGWAMAASLLAVIVLGDAWPGRETGGGGAVLAQAAEALAAAPTGAEARLPDGRPVRALASFRTDLGFCRLIEAGPERGLACRDADAGGWAVALSVPSGEGGGFLPASDLGTGLIDAALDEIGAGPALGPEDEAALLAP